MVWEAMAGHLGWGIIEEGWRKGPWTAEEDKLLIEYVRLHGDGRWNSVARFAGLKRNGKSCRLRWVNYLRPDLKRGQITQHEEKIILELHARWGNRWSTIARSLPGRTDNEIKNYWRTHFKKKGKSASDYAEKSKARLLKRKQLQLQKQQQQNQVEMKNIMSLLDESSNAYSEKYHVQHVEHRTQVRQEMVSMYSNSSEEQCLLPSMLDSDASAPETLNDDILWGGLWNLDDNHGNMYATCATSKPSLPNLLTSFY